MDVFKACLFTSVFNKKILYVLGTLFTVFNGSLGNYRMEDYCYAELSFILESIYQAKLQLTDNYLIDKADSYYPYDKFRYCEAKVEAWYTTYSKLMFYFEDLDLDCDKGHLEFYSGEKSTSRVEGLSYNVCGSVKPKGVFTVESRYFRIKYVPKRRQYAADLFSLIITSYGDDSCPSYDHQCGNSRCINEDVACNDYDSCGDDTGCNLESREVIGVVIGCVAGVGLIVSIVVCCICCRRRSRGAAGTVQSTVTTTQTVTYTGLQPNSQHMYGMNQGTPYNTNIATYPMAAPTNQQSYVQQNYNYNQGTNYQSNYQPNQAPYMPPPPQQGGHMDPSAPPPSYDDVIANANKT